MYSNSNSTADIFSVFTATVQYQKAKGLPTTPQQQCSDQRKAKIRLQGQQMRSYPRIDSAEVRRLRREVGERAASEDPVRMVAEQVVPAGVQFRRLDERHREEVPEVDPDATPSEPVDATTAPARGLLDGHVVDDPAEVAEGHRGQGGRQSIGVEENADNWGEKEQQDVDQDSQSLQPSFQRNRQNRRKLDSKNHGRLYVKSP